MSYEDKFKNFIKMIDEAEGKQELVLIHHPQVIGDNYDEMVESLNRLSDANLGLMIVPRKQR